MNENSTVMENGLSDTGRWDYCWWITSTSYDADIATLKSEHAAALKSVSDKATAASEEARGREQSAGAVRSASGMGNATAVQLPTTTGRNILDIRTGINDDQAKLVYLHEYIRALQAQGVIAK